MPRGGKREGAGLKPGTKHKDSQGVNKAVSIKLSESEARLLALVAEQESMTNRQILMAGVKALMASSVAEILPHGGIEKLKSL